MKPLAVSGLTEVDYISLTIPGKPQPKQRPRRGLRGHFYTPKETQAAEQEVAIRLRLARGIGPVDDASRFYLTCRFYQTRQHQADLDNLLKLVSDAANGIIWKDDRQADRIEAINRFVAAEDQRTEIRIARIA